MWEMIFFSVQSSKTEKFQRNKSCKNVWDGYNDFDSRRFDHGKKSKKTHEVKMSACGHSDGVGVNYDAINSDRACFNFI